MKQIINLDISVYQIVKEHPEILDLLVDLGFRPLKNLAMLNTIGRTTSLKQGAKLIGLDLAILTQELEWNGYEIDNFIN